MFETTKKPNLNEDDREASNGQVYEKPVLLDLEDVVAGCGVCITGGGEAE